MKSNQSVKSIISAFVAVALFTSAAQAADTYWDINGATPGAGGATPSGVWDAATTANWTTDSTGSSATQVWGSGNNAIFSAGSDATGTFSVTDNGTVTVGNLTQNIGHVRIASGTTPTIALSGTSTITTSTRTTADYDLRIDPTISGSFGIIKQGPGVLLLESASSFTGGFTLNAGTVGVETGGNVFGYGTLTLAGGNIEKSWGANSSTSETITNAVNVTGTVDAAIVQGQAGNLAFTGPFTGGGTFCVSNITLNGLALQAATIQISSDISAYTGTFFINVLSANGNRLRFGSGSGSVNLNGASANFVTAGNTSGGNMLDLADGLYGTFQMGSLSGPGGYLHAGWSAGGNTTFQIGALNSITTYAGAIDDNNNGSGGRALVTKVGTGSLTLSGPSTYSQATTIENGTLIAGANVSVSANGPFGNSSSAIVLGDATSISGNLSPSLLIGGAFTMARTVTVGSATTATTGIYTLGGSTVSSSIFSGAITLNQSLNVTQATGGTVTFSAAIGDGGNNLNLTNIGPGTTILSTANTYGGKTVVKGGTLLVNGSTASGSVVSVSGSGSVLGGSGTVNGATTISSSGALTPRPSAGSATTLTFGGNLTLSSASANFTLSTTSGGSNDKINYGSSSTLTLDNTDTINISGTTFDVATDYTLITSTAGTVSMATTPTLKVNGVTSDQTSVGKYKLLISVDGHSLLLHYIQAATPPTVVSANASPGSLVHYQTTTITVNVTPAAGQSISSVTVGADGLGGAGDPVTLTGPGGDGTGNWTGTFTVPGTLAPGSYAISGLVNQSDGGSAPWSVSGITVTVASTAWSGSGSDNKWSTGGNWGSNVKPGNGDSATFSGSSQLVNDLDFNLTLAGLTFDSSAGSYDITDATTTLTLSGGVTNNSAAAQTLDVAVALSGTPTINAAAGNIAVNRVVSGSGVSFTKTGNGTLTLSGVNTYSGATTISAGSLMIGGAGQLGGGTYSSVITNNGALNYNSSAAQTLSGAISGTGTVNNSGSGTLTLSSGSSSFGGGVTVNSGTLTIGAGSTPSTAGSSVTSGSIGTGSLTLAGGGGTLNNSGGYTIANDIHVTGSNNVQAVNGNNWVLNGNITGNGIIHQMANGSTAQIGLGGNNVGFTGTWIQDPGNTSLRFDSASAGSANAAWEFDESQNSQRTRFNFGTGTINFGSMSGSAGSVGLANISAGTATLSVGALNASTTFAGAMEANGANIIALTKVGTGTLTLSGANTYTGNTTINVGTLALSGGGSIASANVSVAAGAALDVSAVTGGSYTLNGARTLTLNVAKSGASLSQGQVVVGSIVAGGTLTVTASGDALADGDAFTLFNVQPSGTFGTVNLPAPGASANWWTPNNYRTLTYNVWPTAGTLALSHSAGLSIHFTVQDLLNHVSATFPGKTFTVTALGNPGVSGATVETSGALSSSSTMILYTPGSTDANDTFTYTVNDGRGGTATGDISLTLAQATGQQATITVSSGAATMKFFGIPGYKYAVQQASSVNGPYSDVPAGDITTDPTGIMDGNGLITAPAAGGFSVTVSPLGGSQGFFQLRSAQ